MCLRICQMQVDGAGPRKRICLRAAFLPESRQGGDLPSWKESLAATGSPSSPSLPPLILISAPGDTQSPGYLALLFLS